MELAGARVFLRADLNVPLRNLNFATDYRLRAILPTIDLIQKKGGKIILATHIGQPKIPTLALSTQKLLPWFKEHGYTIEFEAELTRAHTKSYEDTKTIVLLENLRFFPGEKERDPHFAAQLAQLGDYYVNDAFAVLHRNDASITLTPELFASEQRTIGLLIEREVAMLNKLINSPPQPFVVACGGGKVQDKIPLLFALLPKIQTLLVCPAIVFTFLKMQGHPIGASLVDAASFALCAELLEKARELNVKILFPVDYVVAQHTFLVLFVQYLLTIFLRMALVSQLDQKQADYSLRKLYMHKPYSITELWEILQDRIL